MMKKVNQCFIRKSHPCGKIFGGSKSCFIACPSEDESKIVLELISSKLANLGIEPYIATNERAYGQDIFCTKICGKIIESQFCMVLLDDRIKTISAKVQENIPNPNVYYEYGLMTALKKHIIPLQKDDMDLAFNIQSYDTIKYNDSNLGVELEKAIKTAVEIVEERKGTSIEKIYLESKNFKYKMEINGFKILDKKNYSYIRSEGLSSIFYDTGYYGFLNNDEEILLLLIVVEEKNTIINLAMNIFL